MTEAEFLKDTIAQAELNDIKVVHIPDRTPGTKGMPDLLLVGSHHLIWRELKLEHQPLTSEQTRWKYLLLSTGQDYDIWYPSDRKGAIQDQLFKLNQQ
jgi:hypothetical protein